MRAKVFIQRFQRFVKSTIVRAVGGGVRVASVITPRLSARLLESLFLSPRGRRTGSDRERQLLASAEWSRLQLATGGALQARRPGESLQSGLSVGTLRSGSSREALQAGSSGETLQSGFSGETLQVGLSEETLQVGLSEETLQVYTWGSGPAVLLVHGWAGRGGQLAGFAAPLVDRGLRVVAFDAPAHGASTGKKTSLPDFARAVAAVAASVGPLRAVVAHSLGTAATTYAASEGLDAECFVYLAPPENPGQYLGQMARSIGFSEDVVWCTRRTIESRLNVRMDDFRGARLSAHLNQPLLVVHDREDSVVPLAEGRALAQAWGDSRLIETSGLGHFRILRDAQVLDEAVAFVLSAKRRQQAS